MKIERLHGNEERRILTALIVDKTVLGKVASRWGKNMFQSRWADIVGNWCVKFFNKYKKAPGPNIQSAFETWAMSQKDKATIALVEKFLVSLNDDYVALRKQSNSEHMVDVAARHFTKVRLKRVINEAGADVDEDNLDKAVARLAEFHAVDMGTGCAIDLLQDEEALRAAFEDAVEDVVEYPGELGNFFKGQLGRDAFVMFFAPEKRGKTFWLIDIAWRAMLQGRKVAWFAAGDMSEKQMIRRFAARAARAPVYSKKWPCTVKIPLKMRINDEGNAQVKFKEKEFPKRLIWQDVSKAFQDIVKYKTGTETRFKLAAYPNSTLSVKMIDEQLEEWAKDGWVPDLVVTDYADILDESAAAPGATQTRDKINASWKAQRALSQKWHILYVTASQADADGGTVKLLTRMNFSDDKRKFAHVTGAVGINQTSEEKKIGVYRLNWVMLREGEYHEGDTVSCASCLALGNPAVRSCKREFSKSE